VTTLVVDASVAVEYLLRTQLGDKLAPRLESETLVAPELIDAEVFAVLSRAVRRNELAGQRAKEALIDLAAWGIERVSHRRLWRTAWSFRENVSGYDAFYVAVAAEYDAPLLTADGPLSRAPGLGVLIQNVRS
jgi:predicted nucleic acid-binding protein